MNCFNNNTLTFVTPCVISRKATRTCEQATVETMLPRRTICAVSAPPPPARHAFGNKKMPFDNKDTSDDTEIVPQNIESWTQLDDAIKSKRHKLVVLKVYSRSCRSCKRVERPFVRLCRQYQTDVRCLQLVSECNQDLAQALGVRGFPTFIFYRNGKRVDHFASSSGDTVEEAIIDNL